MHKITSEGVEYVVTVVNGALQFEPPLPSGIEGKKLYNFADMAISRRGPGLNTETSKLAGVGTLDKQFKDDPEYLRGITENAQKLGYKPKPTDVYLEQLVRPGYKTGDPLAFVPAADPTGHIKKVLRKKVAKERKREEYLRKQKIAPDILKRLDNDRCKKDPSFAKLSDGERREALIAKHAPKE